MKLADCISYHSPWLEEELRVWLTPFLALEWKLFGQKCLHHFPSDLITFTQVHITWFLKDWTIPLSKTKRKMCYSSCFINFGLFSGKGTERFISSTMHEQAGSRRQLSSPRHGDGAAAAALSPPPQLPLLCACVDLLCGEARFSNSIEIIFLLYDVFTSWRYSL